MDTTIPSGWECSVFAILLFAEYIDAATTIAAQSGGGGGGATSGWGRDKDEDELSWAYRAL